MGLREILYLAMGSEKSYTSYARLDRAMQKLELSDMPRPELEKMAHAMGLLDEQQQAEVRLQRAMDLWRSVQVGVADGVLIQAIDAAWRDKQLDFEELVGFLAHLGWALPPGYEACHIKGVAMVFGEPALIRHTEAVVKLFPMPCMTPMTPAWHRTNKPMTEEETEAEFAALDELLR